MTHKFTVKRLVVRLCFLMLLAMAGLVGIKMTATKPEFPAETGGQLAKCPDSPNCVSTLASRHDQRMEPLIWEGSTAEAADAIKRVVADNFRRTKLLVERPGYLRFEFKSLIFRFVDDVEFLIDEASDVIHFRSASRVGHSDMGANRRRMTRFVESFARPRA